MIPKTLTMPQAILSAGILIAIAIFGGYFIDNEKSFDQSSGVNNEIDSSSFLKNVMPIRADVDHVRGAADGKIIIYEYSDLECPYCARFHETMIKIVAKYPDEVSWVYRHLPLDGIHAGARPKAIAAECAFQQGGDKLFWSVIDILFEQNLSADQLDDYLEGQAGFDMGAYQSCIEGGEMEARIDRDVMNAVQTLGSADRLTTPWSILQLPDGQLVPIVGAQPYETLAKVIESFNQ